MKKDFNEIKERLQNVNIDGANLWDVKGVNLDLLTNHFEGDEATMEAIRNLQNYYLQILNDDSHVSSMEIKDGKVLITDGKIYHQLGGSIDISKLKSISEIGIVATEWFGILESEQEGFFCTFLNEVKQGQNLRGTRRHLPPEDYPSYSRKELAECTFYFDEKNPVMQELLSLDYFEYQKIKKNAPENLKKLYPQWIIDFYQEINDEQCRFSSTFHDNEAKVQYTWHAIPGGIPPQFINGMCINSLSELNNHIEEIKLLFPNATIFNENRDVIYAPKIDKENHELIYNIHTAKEIAEGTSDITMNLFQDAFATVIKDSEKPKEENPSIGE